MYTEQGVQIKQETVQQLPEHLQQDIIFHLDKLVTKGVIDEEQRFLILVELGLETEDEIEYVEA